MLDQPPEHLGSAATSPTPTQYPGYIPRAPLPASRCSTTPVSAPIQPQETSVLLPPATYPCPDPAQLETPPTIGSSHRHALTRGPRPLPAPPGPGARPPRGHSAAAAPALSVVPAPVPAAPHPAALPAAVASPRGTGGMVGGWLPPWEAAGLRS